MYINRLEELGIKQQISRTRKNQLLEHFPEAQEQFDGRHTVIIFNEEDVVILVKAATIVRKYIMNHQVFEINGCFPAQCRKDSLPASLKLLVSMMLNGSSLQDQEKRDSQAWLTIGQCIVYNSKKNMSHTALKARHSNVSHPFRSMSASMFMRLPEVRNLSRSYDTWAFVFHMTGF
ncbi:hypothetical protein JTB14_036750 [Gonioctena quinquepunctata]|nr:hypothetical protein JTB14_036750 [Gonioctena quinquepunctata]